MHEYERNFFHLSVLPLLCNVSLVEWGIRRVCSLEGEINLNTDKVTWFLKVLYPRFEFVICSKNCSTGEFCSMFLLARLYFGFFLTWFSDLSYSEQ